jgi:hypothetical protein
VPRASSPDVRGGSLEQKLFGTVKPSVTDVMAASLIPAT